MSQSALGVRCLPRTNKHKFCPWWRKSIFLGRIQKSRMRWLIKPSNPKMESIRCGIMFLVVLFKLQTFSFSLSLKNVLIKNLRCAHNHI